MDYEIECVECGWSGRSEELVCTDEDANSNKSTEDIDFNCCPDCGEKDCFEDLED